MKNRLILLVFVAVFGFSGVANATLSTIGTAYCDGDTRNLIYEDDTGLVWLDYSKYKNTWDSQVSWASNLNSGGLTNINLKSGWVLDGVWRLPSAGDTPQRGYHQITSEMGHLLHVSLNDNYKTPPFEDLAYKIHWSSTKNTSTSPTSAWYTDFTMDYQWFNSLDNSYYAIAVKSGHFVPTPVPIPAAVWLLGSGLVGIIGIRRRFKK